MSWRYGVAAYEALLGINGIGKDDEARQKLARKLFNVEKKALYEAIKDAPEILFVCGSGNESNDASFVEYIPASLELPNLITIGAVDSEGKKTSFTTEGASVRFYANGYEVESYVPGGDKVKFSGTSMASPNVVNLAAKLIALDPTLSPQQVIALIEKGSDSLAESPELLLINPRASIALIHKGEQASNSVNTYLNRKWRPTTQTAEVMVTEYIEEVRKQNESQATAMEAQRQLLQNAFAQLTIEYKSDGTVIVSPPGNPGQSGTYELNNEENTITVNIAGETEQERIQSITTTELVTKSSEGTTYKYTSIK